MSKYVFLGAAAFAALSAPAWAQTTPQSDPPALPTPAPAPADKPVAKKAAAQPTAKPQEVTVTAKRADFTSSIDRKSYNLGKDLQGATGSIGDALRNIPSVQVDVQGNLSLRGDSNVTILVDGQPSPLFSGQNRADAIQQLPADQFERVEVITNPSAEFKPDGSAGIINLVTKKAHTNSPKGMFIGSIRANAGTDSRYNAGVSGSYSVKGLSWAGGANVGEFRSRFDSATNGAQPDPTTGQLSGVHSNAIGKSDSTNYSTYGSLSYDLTGVDKLNVGGSVFAAQFDSASTGSYATDATTGPLAQDYTSTTSAHGHFGGRSLFGGVVHKLGGDEHEFSLRVTYSDNSSVIEARSTQVYTLPAQPNLFQDIDSQNGNQVIDLKAEYKGPMPWSAKLVTGYEFQDSRQNIDHPVELGTSATDATLSTVFSNLFKFEQTLNAVYATYQQPLGPLAVMPGLRLEEADIDLNQVTSGEMDSLHYFNVYPTLHLAYQLADGQQLKASYSRRVNRPGASQLNPFRLYNSSLSFSQGNPHLLPQVTDSYELGYEVRDKTGTYYSATFYYRDNHRTFTSVTEDLGAGVLLSTTANLGHSENLGLELAANGKLLKTLSYNISGNVYDSRIDAGNLGFAGVRSTVTEFGNVNVNWEPTPKDFFQVNVHANSRNLTPQGFNDGSWTMNLGYRHKFDDRLSGVVTVQDPFDTSRFHSVIDTPALKQDSTTHPRVRGLFLGVVYALGNPKVRRPDTFDYNGGAAGGAPTP